MGPSEYHPAFSAHFSDPLYRNTSPETAPFGGDEGADLFEEWRQRKAELSAGTAISSVLGWTDEELDAALQSLSSIDDLETAASIRGAGFVVLALTGSISGADLARVLRCLDTEIQIYSDPQWLPFEDRGELTEALRTQSRDLTIWQRQRPGP